MKIRWLRKVLVREKLNAIGGITESRLESNTLQYQNELGEWVDVEECEEFKKETW
jgi:hypothetical protein